MYLYALLLGGVAAALFVVSVHGTAPLTGPELPWWAIAAGFVAAEACVVHVEFRRSAHSFSLADIPFVFGLVFASGDDFIAGALLGTAVIYAFRRLAPVKLIFNLAQLAFVACVAVVIVHALAVPGDTLEPPTWIALYVATLATGALTIVCIAGAIAIAEGGLDRATLRQMFVMDGIVTVTNSSIAIAAALVVSIDARAVPVLLVPALTVFVVYRAYVSERQRHEKLEFLYEANRALSRSPEVAEAIEGVLARSLEAFRSEIAEVVLLGVDGTPLRTTYGPGDERVTMAETDRKVAAELAGLVDHDTPVVSLLPPFGSPRLRALFEQRGIRHAMLAMLLGEHRMIGVIMLANRFGIERGYSPDDLRLLEALANNASVALQYDRLEQAVIKLRSLQEQLRHQAYHDPLTNLPNRSLFMERVNEELERRDGVMAVLFIDVDDFKIVNDSLGHAVGDSLLVSVAGRCGTRSGRRTSSPAWAATSSRSCSPRSTTRRPRRAPWPRASCRRSSGPCMPAKLVSVHVSVGITDSGRRGNADQLIRDADLAMYQAKAKGKSRFEFFEPSLAAAMMRLHDVKEDLAKAIEREQIVVEYQPIVSLETGRISAAEALVRWDHPVRGRVPPAEFVPLSEETGLVEALDRHVLREACRQARRWQLSETWRSRSASTSISPSWSCATRSCAGRPGDARGVRPPPGSSCSRSPRRSCSATRPTAPRGSRSSATSGCGSRSTTSGRAIPAQLPALPSGRHAEIAKPFVDGLSGGGWEAGSSG